MALVEGLKLSAFLDGGFIKYCTSISFVTESGNIPMETLNEGLSGFTEGTGDVTIEVGLTLPSTGPEYRYQQICAQSIVCSMQIGLGAESYAAQGKIMSCSFSQTVNGGAEGTFTWKGPKTAIE